MGSCRCWTRPARREPVPQAGSACRDWRGRRRKEVWFTAAKAGTLSALWGVTLDGHERLIYRSPMRLQLEDVAPDGRVLVSGVSLRTQVIVGSIRDKGERDLSWFDYGTSVSISADGKMVSFNESEKGPEKYGIFVRPATGAPLSVCRTAAQARSHPTRRA